MLNFFNCFACLLLGSAGGHRPPHGELYMTSSWSIFVLSMSWGSPSCISQWVFLLHQLQYWTDARHINFPFFSFCQIQSDSRPSPPSLGCGGKLSSSLMLLGILWGFVVNKLYRHNVFGGDLVVLGCPHSVLQTSSVCPQCIPVPEKANLVTDTSGNFLLTRLRFIQGCNGNNADSN